MNTATALLRLTTVSPLVLCIPLKTTRIQVVQDRAEPVRLTHRRQPRVLEAAYARSWYANITADTFG